MKLKFWTEQFEIRAKNPAVWVLEARRLRRAADLLFTAYFEDLQRMQGGCSPLELKNLEVAAPATLMCGLAFENLFKAAIIKSKGASLKNGRLQEWPGNGHNLIALADISHIKLTPERRDLLSRLAAYVVWAGRYPIPKSQEKMALKQADVSPEWLPLPIQPHEMAETTKFLDELEADVLT